MVCPRVLNTYWGRWKPFSTQLVDSWSQRSTCSVAILVLLPQGTPVQQLWSFMRDRKDYCAKAPYVKRHNLTAPSNDGDVADQHYYCNISIAIHVRVPYDRLCQCMRNTHTCGAQRVQLKRSHNSPQNHMVVICSATPSKT